MIGRVLAGRYELGEVLGEGGMAVVYRAHDRTLDRDVAVKVLREQYASDPELLARFEREARAAARLAHPTVVDIYDVGAEGATHFIVMELVEGGERGSNLKQLVRRGGPLSPAQVIRFGREIAAALDFAHRRGLIHRDVKPQNVLIDAGGRARLTDFGIAQAVENVSLTQTGSVMGTAQYMAPEQARGRGAGPASDVYSLGVVLYELATGRLPFEGDTPLAIALRHVEEAPTPPRRLNPSIPPSLEAVILRAMEKDPARRFASAADLAQALAEAPDPIRERTARVAVIEPGRRAPDGGRRTTNGATVAPRTTVRPAAEPGGRRPPERRAPPPRRRQESAGAGGLLVMLLLILISLGALALGFNWLFNAPRPAPAPIATPTVAPKPTAPPVIVSTPTPLPARPTATPLPATATPLAATPTPAPTVAPTQAPSPTRPPAPPTPLPTPVLPQVIVPRLVGLPLNTARQVLSALGLNAAVTELNDPHQPEGLVLDQAPKAGEGIVPSGSVSLVVNRLPAATVAVPNVGGLEENEARKALSQAGLKVVVDRAAGGRKGVVTDQSPEPGVKVPPGSEVKIVLGS